MTYFKYLNIFRRFWRPNYILITYWALFLKKKLVGVLDFAIFKRGLSILKQISKLSDLNNSFFKPVENSISSNIKMRHFSLEPIFHLLNIFLNTRISIRHCATVNISKTAGVTHIMFGIILYVFWCEKSFKSG